ncbi:hypothetical protein BS78_05G216700 [Paspalum vaginatum]|nr:hypothetical protein BS78_05G216700 [Paspalum vaginatum]
MREGAGSGKAEDTEVGCGRRRARDLGNDVIASPPSLALVSIEPSEQLFCLSTVSPGSEAVKVGVAAEGLIRKEDFSSGILPLGVELQFCMNSELQF